MSNTKFATTDAIRTMFARAMSEMYRTEVPQYGTLLDLVAEVNQTALAQDPVLAASLERTGERERLHLERHGAVRLGTSEELGTIARVFRTMGMFPVGYYDLSSAGVPVHATAFRPIDEKALRVNPFRVFTSLLRLSLVEDETLRRKAAEIVAGRQIFTPALLELLDKHDRQGGLGTADADSFVTEALETFRWHSSATVSVQTYHQMHDAHRLIADIVCFRGPHINHLTPRTLDIDAAQAAMPERGIAAKATIEGPPRRACPILLRQTSFKALEEPIVFEDHAVGAHTARFGEVEQRGVALTPEGRRRYDALLASVPAGPNYNADLTRSFAAMPDHWSSLRAQKLAFFRYRAVKTGQPAAATLESLIEQGLLTFEPIIYEDFLPVSAAGIFQSNLGGDTPHGYRAGSDRGAFEDGLGVPVRDEFDLYARAEQASLDAAFADLDLEPRR